MLGTWSTAYGYSIKRCPVPFQCAGLNFNSTITDLASFNSTYAKELNKVNLSVSSSLLFVFLSETTAWPRGRDLSYN